jgi:hypothetical protein
MRHNVIIALLSACATLLAVNLVVSLRSTPQLAFGQAVGEPQGGFVVATGQTQSGGNAVCYLFDIGKSKLAAYTVKGQGIDFLGMRTLTYDLSMDAEEIRPGGGSISPDDVRKLVGKKGKKKEKEKEKE